MTERNRLLQIWGSHSGEDVDIGHVDCNAVWVCGQITTFRRNTCLLADGHSMFLRNTGIYLKPTWRYNIEDQHRQD